ncbi:hypothetical protein [Actinocatenispora sera]|uniref:Nucleoside phosphorylase domain-containing protein n=1 Tax=Actinocatenispora sera TaxID=390989 RepID=A0A810L0E5_9ACTN|nr:hypothetical protein [Actinocatenispora sera]BCJ28259.1 hypothetical protein Asera_23670 [Actinocatenispora sera]
MTVLLAPMRAEARALRRGAARTGPPGGADPAGTGMALSAGVGTAGVEPAGTGAPLPPRPAGAGAAAVLHTGVGPGRAARAAARLAGHGVVVAGVGGGLVASLHTGDVVLADKVRGPDGAPVRLDGTAQLAALLRAAGCTVHIGPVASRRRLVAGTARDRLAGTGALVADTESYWLLSGPARPVGCLRVVADCAPGPVFGPATLWHLRTALRRLRDLAEVLAGWAATAGPAVRNESHQPLKEVR